MTADEFTAAYRAHSRSILIFLARRTYDPETALDLTAETFAQAYGDVARRLAITEPAARARVSRGLRSIGRALTIQETSA